MKRSFVLILGICGVILFLSNAYADVLYWSDYDLGSNPFPQAITELGLNQETAADVSDFNTKLAVDNYSLAILFLQSNYYDASQLSNLPDYLNNGGKVIFTDWTMDNTKSAWFGTTYTGAYNSDTVTLNAGFLTNGIGNTLNLTNPGWGTFSMDMALNGATQGAFFADGGVAVAYTSNSIINGMLSDTFTDPAMGLQFAKNEIGYLQSVTVTPEPVSMLLFGVGGLTMAALRKKKK